MMSAKMRDTLREALTTKENGPKIIVASSECSLNKQRRVKPLFAKAVKDGKRMVKERFGVDADVCTGDHACIRLSGCPSLSVKHTDDPLKDDPVAAVDNSCVGCGNCGEVAEAAVLCPSFYRADIIHNPSRMGPAAARNGAAQSSASCNAAAKRAASSSRRDAMLDVTAPSKAVDASRLATDKPISIAVLAMGGQGGGVLSDWIVALAEACGWCAQSTSVPGVAQRTGATIYYIEMLPAKDGVAPVLSLMPSPGDVDIVLAAELMEAGRSMLRGLVTPDKTVLIASTHRSFAVAEKEKPGDGIGDPLVVTDAAGVAAKRTFSFDMEALAAKHGSVISATMFGALAGAEVLPFPREAFEKVIARRRQGHCAEPQGLRRRLRARAGHGRARAVVAHASRSASIRCPARPAISSSTRWSRASRGNFRPPFTRCCSPASSASSISRTRPMPTNISTGSPEFSRSTRKLAARRAPMR